MNKDLIYDKAEKLAEETLCNKQCLCPDWKAAGMCCSCDVFMGLREYYASKELKTLNKMSWREIAEIIATGDAPSIFDVGEEKEIELKDGQKVTVVILDFDHDKENTITFGFRDCIDGAYPMNEYVNEDWDSTNVGGWETSKMRNVFMQRLFNLLPNDLQDIIKTVSKNTSKGGGSDEIITTQDKLFLLSEVEVFGDTDYSAGGEGVQYKYFEEKENIKAKRNGVNDWYWLRSPHRNSSASFCLVGIGGNADCLDASDSYGVRPAFSI